MMIDRLREYVGHETPTGDAKALNAFADRLVARYGELGGTARRVPMPTGDHVVADFPGRGPLRRGAAAALPRAPRHRLAGRAAAGRDALA